MRYLFLFIILLYAWNDASAYQVVVIGNSITSHPPKIQIGWNKNNGMAASSIEQDYVHVFLNKLNVSYDEAYIRSGYPIESDFKNASKLLDSLLDIFKLNTTITVIQLGDNVRLLDGKLPDEFQRSYIRLVDAASTHSKYFFCISTWWKSEIKDNFINSVCDNNGGKYIYIGDIRSDSMIFDEFEPVYKDSGVNSHPKNLSMNIIANRLYNEYLKRIK